MELSQNLQELPAQTQHYYRSKFFFSMFDYGYEILVETPSSTKQCVVRAFMDYMKDFIEKTLCNA
jgi:hypothetical protein